MPGNKHDREFFRILSQGGDAGLEEKAPSRLKARIYYSLIREQQATGPLQSLSETEASGHGLCVFEHLVQIAPIGDSAKEPFFCWACHARLLAERMENAPIFWPNCPYAGFRKR